MTGSNARAALQLSSPQVEQEPVQHRRRDQSQDQHQIPPESQPNQRLPEPKQAQTSAAVYTQPSSSRDGFFQAPPRVGNQFEEDVALRRVLALTLPPSTLKALTPPLTAFGTRVLAPDVVKHIADAEAHPPYLRTWDTWGVRRDELVTSEGWRALQALGIEAGMVAIGHEPTPSAAAAGTQRTAHFAHYHLWAGSSAWVNCPSLMTDGVARLLRRVVAGIQEGQGREEEKRVLQAAFERLVSRDPQHAWTSGQWMTERAGGSDVSKTETLARWDPAGVETGITGVDGARLGAWRVDGFKWFSSATDAQMTVFLARTPRGVSLFYAPMRRTLPDGGSELNGITIQRLKQKLGTRALPTAELELKGMRAWLIGEEGRGTKAIATVLNIARIHNAVTAVGFWGRGLGIARAFARVRKTGDKDLVDVPAHMKSLARMHGEYRANMWLTFFVVQLLGVDEFIVDYPDAKKPATSILVPNVDDATHLLRLLTPVAKGLTAKAAISGLQECMEALGGVGYLENEQMEFNIARIYRDANVLSIWEGTTDMMAHDVIRVVMGKTSKQVMEAMDRWTKTLLDNNRGAQRLQLERKTVGGWWKSLKNDFGTLDSDELHARARELMERLGNVVSGALLVADALSDDNEAAIEVTARWVASREAEGKYQVRSSWKEGLKLDRAIVFGGEIQDQARL